MAHELALSAAALSLDCCSKAVFVLIDSKYINKKMIKKENNERHGSFGAADIARIERPISINTITESTWKIKAHNSQGTSYYN